MKKLMPMLGVLIFALALSLWMVPTAVAGEHGGEGVAKGGGEHGGTEVHEGSHGMMTGDDADTLLEAAAALQTSHPELAAKLKTIVKGL